MYATGFDPSKFELINISLPNNRAINRRKKSFKNRIS